MTLNTPHLWRAFQEMQTDFTTWPEMCRSGVEVGSAITVSRSFVAGRGSITQRGNYKLPGGFFMDRRPRQTGSDFVAFWKYPNTSLETLRCEHMTMGIDF